MKNFRKQPEKLENELLFLMPLVQTAWAHGAIAAREKHLIFEAARADGIDERASLNDKLDNYLINQPSLNFFDECLSEIAVILQSMNVSERESLKSKVIKRCRNVADSAGGNSAMDVSAFRSAEERATLAQIGEALNINSTNKGEAFGTKQTPIFA
jgi:hypothetical protein